MKTCWVPLFEICKRTTMYHLPPGNVAILPKSPNSKYWTWHGNKRTCLHRQEEHSQHGEQQENSWKYNKTDQPQNSNMPLPGVPLSSEIIIPKHTCTTTITLFAAARTQKPAQHPSTGEWRNKHGVHTDNATVLRHKKEWNNATGNNTAGGRGDHTNKCTGDKEQKHHRISPIGGH